MPTLLIEPSDHNVPSGCVPVWNTPCMFAVCLSRETLENVSEHTDHCTEANLSSFLFIFLAPTTVLHAKHPMPHTDIITLLYKGPYSWLDNLSPRVIPVFTLKLCIFMFTFISKNIGSKMISEM